MGRRKKQSINFPSKEMPPPSDSEIDLDIEGSIDVEGLGVQQARESFVASSTERLKEENRKKTEALKIAKEIPVIFKPEDVEFVFDGFVGILCFVYSIFFKVDYKLLWEELKFEKEQKELMAKPLAKILSKYAPSEWAAMPAEIELISMMAIYVATSFKRAGDIAKEEKLKARNSITRNGPQNTQREVSATAVPV